MKKLIVFMLLICLCLTAGCAKSEKENELDFSAISEELIALNAEKSILERELATLMEKYEIALSGGECCFVFFADNMERNLMDSIYPAINSVDFKATAVMSDMKAPGQEGCITLSDYNTLKEKGWDFAIGTGELNLSEENGLEELKAYIDSYRALLAETGIEMPKTICFQETLYDKDYAELLLTEGFKVVRCDSGLKDKFSRAIGRDGLYILGSGLMKASSTSTLKREMTSAHENAYTYSIVVKKLLQEVVNKGEECNISKYKSMLSFVIDDCTGANVFTATELYDYKSEAVALESGFKEEELKEIEAKEARIAEINSEIEKINETLRNY